MDLALKVDVERVRENNRGNEFSVDKGSRAELRKDSKDKG